MAERLSRRDLIAGTGVILFLAGTAVIGVKTGISVDSASKIPRPPDEDVKRAIDIMYEFKAKTDSIISGAEEGGVAQVEITIPQEVVNAKKILDLNRPYNEKIRNQNSDAFSGLSGKAAAISTCLGLGIILIDRFISHIKNKQ